MEDDSSERRMKMDVRKPFCGNKKCLYHKTMVLENQYKIHVVSCHGEQEIERYRYINKSGKKFELCSICHEAINMVKE